MSKHPIDNLNLNEQDMWQAVLDRDPQYRHVFVYAVRSTGIYCLPTCPSRRPRRNQVSFFDSSVTAEAAGFRPCQRCNPNQSISPNDRIVEKAIELINHPDNQPLSLAKLSQTLDISPSHLHRIFKSKTGLTPHQYAAAQRLRRFKERVKSGEPVASALYSAGYHSSSRLYEKAAKTLGMTPAVYRNGGRGLLINFTIRDTYLGKILLAGTQRGVCRVEFGSDESQLEIGLHLEFPAAQINRNDAALKPWMDIILQVLDGSRSDASLPLDIQGTAFQQRVWNTLQKIPYGSTRTYSEIAESIGQPRAARAVASACASNPVALITPCHRVVRSDGKIGGYRWGEERKQALLAQEKALKKGKQ